MDHSVVEVDISCVRCPFQETKRIRWDKNQQSSEIKWVCPTCKAEKKISMSKMENQPGTPAEQAPERTRSKTKTFNYQTGETEDPDRDRSSKFFAKIIRK